MTQELSEIVSVRFPKSQVEALRRVHAKDGILPSETIRRAVRCWLEPGPCELCLANPPEKIEHTDD